MRFATLLAENVSKRRIAGIATVILLHAAAAAILIWSEKDVIGIAAFVLSWGILNFFWLLLFRRPGAAAAVSLALVGLLIVVSWFKHQTLTMTVTFTDLMVIDQDTAQFLLTMWPNLQEKVIAVGAAGVLAFAAVWWLDPFRIRRVFAAFGLVLSCAFLATLSFAFPLDREDEFFAQGYVSKLGRSATVAIYDLIFVGVFDADAVAAEVLQDIPDEECSASEKLPIIIYLFDESSFDISRLPGIRVWPNYQWHFQSFDGKARRLIVEGSGGPSWFTEYNVLTGLSVRSYGRFAQGATRLAGGRVGRGLAHALRRCGYRTFSFYPYLGAFLGARSFQTTAGVEFFRDARDLRSRQRERDMFYFENAIRTITWERGSGPLFLYVYTSQNHLPYNFRYLPSALPNWKSTGNRFEVDEYLRRQALSMIDYSQFLARLRDEFPDQPFLIVRFGDHQPLFARDLVDPSLSQEAIAERIRNFDPRYFTTYYTIETLNFSPVDISSAFDSLDAPYLPLIVLEAAGVPLDQSFVEQKKILQRCRGQFYFCNNGAEVRRFNRMLIDAGLIKGL
jgi:hypothetical protein